MARMLIIAACLLATLVAVQSKSCPGGTSQCADTQTCCPFILGGYGCCPYQDAACCSDKQHCCPHGTTCDVTGGRCVQGPGRAVAELLQIIKA